MPFNLRVLSLQCTQPGDSAFWEDTLLGTGECLCLQLCKNLHACVLCVHAGHDETARPDVPESGLCGVTGGSLADSADFEQCTQVSPANELSI